MRQSELIPFSQVSKFKATGQEGEGKAKQMDLEGSFHFEDLWFQDTPVVPCLPHSGRDSAWKEQTIFEHQVIYTGSQGSFHGYLHGPCAPGDMCVYVGGGCRPELHKHNGVGSVEVKISVSFIKHLTFPAPLMLLMEEKKVQLGT